MKFLKILHWVIIINFVLELVYAAYEVFFVVGGGLPLMGKATTISHDVMVTRRLYAIEFWIACTGLSIYLAITEYLPRLMKQALGNFNK